MIHGTIEVSGATEDDIELAIEAALDSIRRGNTSGFDRNETGSYRFELTERADDAQVNWTRLSADHWESEERDPDGAPLVRAMRQNEDSPWRVSVSGHPELHGPYPSFTHARHAVPTLLADDVWRELGS